ncbi:MAG: amino acid adenylation domain-containing protein, partial [Nostocales cyanobacterium]
MDIQGWSDVPRGTSLFDSLVVFENYPLDEDTLECGQHLRIEDFQGIEQTNYGLTLISAPGEKLSLKVVYDNSRFDAETINRMLGHLITLLEATLEHPQGKIQKLPILTEVEKQTLLIKWNNTLQHYPQDKCIHQLFEEQVAKKPDAIAVVFEEQKLTYLELNQKANQLANYLISLGVKPDTLVGICVERSLEMMVGILGILKAGGAYVPFDPEYPQERISYMLEDSGIKVLLTQHSLIDKLPKNQAQFVYLDDEIAGLSQTEIPFISDVKSSNLAYVLYTSGSTGKPKAVAIEHHSPVALVTWAQQVFTLEQLAGVLASTSVCFDLSVFEFFVPLSVGGKVIIAENALHLSTMKAANEVTLINTVPSVMSQLVREKHIPPQVKTVNLAGEALQNQLVQQIYQHSQTESVFNLYGPSEDTTYSTYSLVEKGSNSSPNIGRPIANTQVYILDKNVQPVPVEVPGELYIGGAGLARCYLNRPELTAEKFIPNPFDKGLTKLYKTGDLVRYLHDGNIEYIGRIDNQVKIRGFRIELGEIETALQHADIQASCVIVREDNPGDKRLVAYIVSEKTLEISELRQHLKNKLPEYMIPNAFVYLESLPLTPNGKIDRRALPAPSINTELIDKYIAPGTPTEEILTAIWAQILGIEQIGIKDNFFELGGHSLLATQLLSQIRVNFQVEIPLRNIFSTPILEEQAQLIEQTQKQQTKLQQTTIKPRTENTEIPLSFAQQRLWFIDQLEQNIASYNLSSALELQGDISIIALENSFLEIINRHESLRTNFIEVNGKPQQIIHYQTNWKLSVIDLHNLSPQTDKTEIETLVKQQVNQPFNLAEDSLIRANLIKISDTESVLILCMHH